MRGWDRSRRYDLNAASRRQANRRRRRQGRAWLYSVQFLPLPEMGWLTWPW